MNRTFEESLIVMDLADRLRYHDAKLEAVTDLAASREAVRTRIKRFYASQGLEVDDGLIDQAIEQRISQRLVHHPISGKHRLKARICLFMAQSSWRLAGCVGVLTVIVLAVCASVVRAMG